MAVLKTIRLKNFRSFGDSGKFEINPLTILVGKNSSGKSSFLRMFPLLRQSFEVNTKGPILWNGKIVDLGAFEEVITRHSESKEIKFEFTLDISSRDVRKLKRRTFGYLYAKYNDKIEARVELGLISEKKQTRARSLCFSIQGLNAEIIFEGNDVSSLTINNVVYEDKTLGLAKYNYGRFLPEVLQKVKRSRVNSKGEQITVTNLVEFDFFDLVRQKALRDLKKYFYHTTSTSTVLEGVTGEFITNDKMFGRFLEINYKTNQTFSKNFKNKREEIINKYKMYNYIFHMASLLDGLNSALMNTFKTVKYHGPLRAVAERYYRFQDLQVDEIDHTGSNLPMVLNSLSPRQKREFELWTERHFGFSVKLIESGWHYALHIQTEEDGEEYNINDMGFGFSQLLPIIASIWLETQNLKRTTGQLIFAIEQPELHLHPALQSKVAEMFCKVISTSKEMGIDLRIIFETHSKAMIDSIGDCIERSIVSKKDITLAVFDKYESNCSNISFAKYEDNGMLIDWPIGFFSGSM